MRCFSLGSMQLLQARKQNKKKKYPSTEDIAVKRVREGWWEAVRIPCTVR